MKKFGFAAVLYKIEEVLKNIRSLALLSESQHFLTESEISH